MCFANVFGVLGRPQQRPIAFSDQLRSPRALRRPPWEACKEQEGIWLHMFYYFLYKFIWYLYIYIYVSSCMADILVFIFQFSLLSTSFPYICSIAGSSPRTFCPNWHWRKVPKMGGRWWCPIDSEKTQLKWGFPKIGVSPNHPFS